MNSNLNKPAVWLGGLALVIIVAVAAFGAVSYFSSETTVSASTNEIEQEVQDVQVETSTKASNKASGKG